MNTKIKLAKGTQVLYRRRDGETGTVTAQRAICYVDCVHESTAYANATGKEDGSVTVSLSLNEEGKTWVRGWTGKVATAFKRAIAAEDRKRKADAAARERKLDEEYAAYALKRFRHAAAIVKRAKLPRDLRPAAFTAALGVARPMMMWPWMHR
jgi:hypothetical protein